MMGIDYRPLSDFLAAYKELNKDGSYEPVAVGRYGIRKRSEIYSKELAKDYKRNRLIRKDTLTIGMGSRQIDFGILSTDAIYSVSPAYKTYKINGVDSDYLRYCLEYCNADMSRRFMVASCRQGKAVDVVRLLDYEIPIYSSRFQRSLVDELDHLCALKKNAEDRLAILDQIVKSRFVEMFGEGAGRQSTWDEVFKVRTGKLDSNAAVEGGVYPFFTCSKVPLAIDSFSFDCEALLLAGNNAAGVYDVKHYKGKFDAYQRTYVLELKNSNWEYELFRVQLQDKLSLLQRESKGTMTKYLTLGILRKLKFVTPPLSLQREFAAFVAEVDKSKLTLRETVATLDQLYRAKLQEYFG